MSGPDFELRQAVQRLRRQWRRRVLLEGAARIAAAVVLAILAGAALTAILGGGSTSIVLIRAIGYFLIVGALVRYFVLPAFRKAGDRQLALYAEEQVPELRQALVSAVHELDSADRSASSSSLSSLVVHQALVEVRRLQAGPGLERSRVQRAAGVFGGVVAFAALLVLAGPTIVRDAARVLFVPWAAAAAEPVLAVEVTPGNAAVPKGGAIQVGATLRGFESDAAELVIRADTATEWIRIPMQRDSLKGEFSTRLFDLVQATEYYVESDGVKSPAFRLTVTDLPAVQRLALHLRFPAYTGLEPERIDPGGDVAALVGTTVTVRATVTRPIGSATIRLDDKTVVPLKADDKGQWVGSFRVTKDGFYRVDVVAPDGTEVPGAVQYVIEALEDRAPTVAIEQPGRDTKVTSVEEVSIALRASDDYGVAGLELRYSVNGGPEQRVPLSDSTTTRATAELRAVHTIFLEELSLKAGDLVSYHARARDGAGGTGSSDIYFLEVRPFGRDYRQAESGGGGGGGGGGNSPEGLSARQRDIIAATFNSVRDSARTPAKQRREDLATLAVAQGRLKQDVANLVRRLVERNIAGTDTNFAKIKDELEAAGREMQTAEELLGRGGPRDALPPENRALQHVQRAEAVYREVMVQLGGGGGGGGGGGSQSRAEDLADLFELENDKLQNQYESVQRSQSQAAEQQVDEAMERLRQLAARQQQENERMQRMADALRQRAGSQSSSGGGGGGGSSQRDLAQQTEEEARRLERLAREQNQPQLGEVARQLREASDAMRRAAGESPNAVAQGGTALDRLRNAARNLENSRTSALSERIRNLQRQADDLVRQQQEIAEGVNGLSAAGADRAERLRRLDDRKQGLAADVDRLQSEAERTAREARREQPGAAGRVGQAADDIQQSRVRDRILYSRDVMRGNSPEYARRFEEQISENLSDAAARLREAAGALTESADGRRDRALERARELVRGLESLQNRLGDRSGQPGRGTGPGSDTAATPGQPGSESAQGQAQGQGQGQGGQQGREGQGQASGQSGRAGQGGEAGQQGTGGNRNPADGNRGGLGSANPSGGGAGQPGGMSGEAIRQFSREFGLRRQAAESLRRELAREGIDTRELDRAISGLRRLESGTALNDPLGREELQAAIIEGLKTWEFRLWRTLGNGGDKGPAVGAPSQAPAEYRALVEEYYRALARDRKP